MENLLQNIASGLWIVLGVYCFFGLRKWNKWFGELYDELKREVEGGQPCLTNTSAARRR